MTAIEFRKGNKRIRFTSLKDAARKTRKPYITLYMRINTLGWPVSKAITTPVRKYAA